MSTIKHTPQSITRRQHKIALLNAQIERLSEIQKGKESVFWKVLEEFLTEAVKKHNLNIETLMDQNDLPADIAWANIKKNYGLKVGAQAVIDLVKDPAGAQAELKAQIKILEDQLKVVEEQGAD